MSSIVSKKCYKCKQEKPISCFNNVSRRDVCIECKYVYYGRYVIPSEPQPVKEIEPRYVYLIRGGDYIKIGIAKDVEKRIKTMKTGSPVRLELVYCFFSKKASVDENNLHKLYAKQRVFGEWFNLSQSDVENIKSTFL